jgi:ABC-type antimicrobial peptide transport system permease subunit
LSGLFGLAGLLLVGLGLYGMVAQGVAGHRKELGIRLALGAKVGSVVGGTIARALLLVLAGVAVGILLAAPVARTLRSLLYGVGPADPVVILTLVTVVLAVGVLAAAVPASRIARIDPSEALRHE